MSKDKRPPLDGTRFIHIMSLLTSEAGKRRLLSVEIPAIDRYNEGRDEAYRIRLKKTKTGLILLFKLKPGHNVYDLEIRLTNRYPEAPPETRLMTPIRFCPHLLDGQMLCMWRQGSSRAANRWDPARFTCVFAVQAAWRWLACYEIWHETGEWPIPEAT